MSTSRLFAIIAGVALAAVLAAILIIASTHSARSAGEPVFAEASPAAAESLRRKIDAIQGAHGDPARGPGVAETLTATDIEMESFVLYSMKDDIPARVGSIDVGLDAGIISAATELTFDSEKRSGNPVVDMLMRGTHRLFVKGAMEGRQGRGKFQLEEVRVDGFPVPIFVVEALVDRYVKPRYPHVDLHQPFDIPWGVEEIALSPGVAAFTY